MLKSAEVEIKKEHQVLMVNKTTSFKKGRGEKNFKKDGKAVATPGKPDAGKKKKNGPKHETECFYCKGKGQWKRNCPKYLADKKAGNVKGFVDPKGANKVCKLQRSIYGLVQASRSWNIRFNEMSNVNLNFNAFLEKNKMKDDGSNYADWVRNLKLILEAAKKAYVLNAPLGDPPAPTAAQDILNV
ncbi:hypothetical protein ZWY2020_056105 [Hordeum vulgare]|nr:hypothetical protein ZWY2020_056105 [Hordeum vulgare]